MVVVLASQLSFLTIMSQLNDLLRWIKESVSSEIQSRRIEMCKRCDRYNNILHMCNECKCLVDLKTRLARQRCPLNKWEEIK